MSKEQTALEVRLALAVQNNEVLTQNLVAALERIKELEAPKEAVKTPDNVIPIKS